MKKPSKAQLIKLNRFLSWLLVVTAVVMIVSGYSSRRHFFDRYLMTTIHLWFEWLFIGLLAFHFFVVTFVKPFQWKTVLWKIKNRKANPRLWLRLIQRLLGWAIAIIALLLILYGLSWYLIGLGKVLPFSNHPRVDIYLTLLLIVHTGLGGISALMRKGIRGPVVNVTVLAIAIALCLFVIVLDFSSLEFGRRSRTGKILPDENPIETPLRVEEMAEVSIEKDTFTFNSIEVDTVRPDLFNPGYFSMFDVLVYLDTQGMIQLEYHFDDSMNTHVIDSINEEPDWWYWTYYTGGWRERNVFRMDHYPWKEGTTLQFYREDPDRLEKIYSIFKDEVTKRKNNDGKLVIPQVIIRAPSFTELFENIEVTPHNLRSDVYQEGITTTIDVIMSLGDQDRITYELKWYESIGSAKIVKSYWVEAINGVKAYSTCGFVYEVGSHSFGGFTGNHIHLPADVRILNSPDYVEFFWICL